MYDLKKMKKPQQKLFVFLETLKLKDLDCFLKFKNITGFEKTMNRLIKSNDELECEDYNLEVKQIKDIMEKIVEYKKTVKKIKKKSSPKKKSPPKPKNLDKDRSGFEDFIKQKDKTPEKKKSLPKKKTPEKKKSPQKKKVAKKKGKYSKEECHKFEKSKDTTNNKVVDPKTGRKIKLKNKNGKLTKKAKDIQEDCDKNKENTPEVLEIIEEINDLDLEPKKKSPSKSKPKTISPETDECKVDDNCDSKCCLDNQCVDGKICKNIEKMKKFEKMKKKMEEEEKKIKGHKQKLQKQKDNRIEKLKDLSTDLNNFGIRIKESIEDYQKRKEKFIKETEKIMKILKQRFYTEKDKDEEKLYLRLEKNLKELKDNKKTPKKETPKKDSQKIGNKDLMQIKADIKTNKLDKEDYEKILKKLNLKSQKEYLKELLIIGLDNL